MTSSEAIEILRYALHLSDLPNYKFTARSKHKSASVYPHVGPFVAQIACNNHMLRIDNIECSRADLEGALCDLMLRHFYPGEHIISNVEALQMQWSCQVMGPGGLDEFKNEVDKYRRRFKGMNRKNRKCRIGQG